MYLDAHERDEMQKLVMSFHIRWFSYTMERIGAAQAWRSLLLMLTYFVGLAAIIFTLGVNQQSWAAWVLCGALIVLLQLSYRWYKKQVKEKVEDNSPEKWYQEIDTLDVDGDDRQLFMQLLNDMRASSSKEEFASVAEEASRSPTLSQLSFVRELRAYIQ